MNGDEIRDIRIKLGLSQATFAYLLNISFSTLNRWENNKAAPDEEHCKQLLGLKEILDKEGVDKSKVLESIKTVGVGPAVAIGAAAGLVSSPAMSVLLGPIAGGVAGALASLFLKKR